jgi:protein phosphatase
MALFGNKYFITHGYGASDTGKVRQNNEDAFFADDDLGLYIVCDGMGGHNSGEVASAKCIEALKEYIALKKTNSSTDYKELLSEAVKSANSLIYTMSQGNPALRKMGTTAVVLLIKDGNFYAAWSGDSRLYLLRKDKLTRLTKDHSKVQMLIDSGITTEEKAWNHPDKNIILSAVGFSDNIEPGIIFGSIKDNDLFLLCSDGIHGEIKDNSILDVLRKEAKSEKAVSELIKEALKAVGTDNATAILVAVKGD